MEFIARHQRVWTYIAELLKRLLPDHAEMVSRSLFPSLLGGMFHYAVLNLEGNTPPHRDSKDYDWSCVVPLGDFTGGELCLTYGGVRLPVRRGDLAIMHSRRTWHHVERSEGRRGSIVLTNHTTVLLERDQRNIY